MNPYPNDENSSAPLQSTPDITPDAAPEVAPTAPAPAMPTPNAAISNPPITALPRPMTPPTPRGPMTPPTPPNKQRKVKPIYVKTPKVGKTKKKHTGLWVFLSLVVICIGIFGFIKWRNHVATKTLLEGLTNQPFTYSGIDYIDYVTENVELPTEIKLKKDKTASVVWSSSCEEVLDAKGTVHRPKDSNKTVTLTATMKHAFGKGKASYTFTVVKTDTASEQDIFVLSNEEIESGYSEHNLFVTYDDNDQITSIYGSFGQTEVASLEDALYVVELYRPLLELDASVTFVGADVKPGLKGKTYQLQQVKDAIPFWNKTIVLTTNEKDRLQSITLHVCRNTDVNPVFALSEDELAEIAAQHLGCDVKIDSIQTGISTQADNIPIPAYSFVASFMKAGSSGMKQLIVHADTKEVLGEQELFRSLFGMELCIGKDVFGQTREFEAYKAIETYQLKDPKRDISIIEGATKTWTDDEKYFANKWGDMAIILERRNFASAIENKSTIWDNPQAVSSYVNLCRIYDWYQEHLNRDSFDGKSGAIRCVVNTRFMTDNAAYSPFNDFFLTGPAYEIFDYPPCGALDTMAHEFTHGVFEHVAGNEHVSINWDRNYMHVAIDEGYADIFACLIEGNWQMGESLSEYVMRDPTGYEEQLLLGHKYPTKYFDENWSYTDGHIDSILLSRAAYRMSVEGFSDDDIAKIWYQSMHYGYDTSSDFLDVRANVLRAAKECGYSEEQREIIAEIFGQLGIGGRKTKEILNHSISGHELMDDTIEQQFFWFYSPVGSLLGTPFYVVQMECPIPHTLTDEEISEIVSKGLSYSLASNNSTYYDPTLEIDYNIKIKYRRVSEKEYRLLKTVLGNLFGFIRQTQIKFGIEDVGFFEKYVLQYELFYRSNYDFWREEVGIDFPILAKMGLLEEVPGVEVEGGTPLPNLPISP